MSHYDLLECQPAAAREARLLSELRATVAHAKAHSPYYQETLSLIEPDELAGPGDLAKLPLLRKSDLIEAQAKRPPFAGIETTTIGDMRRLFLSPGPIAEAQTTAGDSWRMARALFAAGFQADARVMNCFSYHLTPAGFMFDAALEALGCVIFPGGVGNTDSQIEAISRFGLTGYVGTPDFLKIILTKADELGVDTASMARGLVTGGPLFPELRRWYDQRGIHLRQCYGTAELGLIAYESEDPSQGMVIDEHCVLEIVRPGTGELVADGEVGEVVVTSFDKHYPLIRLATGDLSAVTDAVSLCGRTNRMLKGWMGRADQTTKVRGLFVHPEQVAKMAKAFPGLGRLRLVVAEQGGHDQLTLQCECEGEGDQAALGEKLKQMLRTICHLNGDIEILPPGRLPNDGKVIDDLRAC